MATIKLSNSLLVTVIDDEDCEKAAGYNWHLHSEGYAAAAVYRDGKTTAIYMHRLLANGALADHRDRDKLNNRRSNLRLASRSQNGGNRAKTTKKTASRFKGVFWESSRSKWTANLQLRQATSKRLGSFTSEEDAARAYNAAAYAAFGEFALLNHV